MLKLLGRQTSQEEAGKGGNNIRQTGLKNVLYTASLKRLLHLYEGMEVRLLLIGGNSYEKKDQE